MKDLLISLVLVSLAFASTFARGQGVALTAPAASDARTEAKKLEPGIASVTPVKVNPSALESNIVNLTVEGTTYRFRGTKRPAHGTQFVNGRQQANTVEAWTGNDGDNIAAFYRDGSSVYGQVTINGQRYEVFNFALVKIKDVPMIETPTPAMLESARLIREEQAKKVIKP